MKILVITPIIPYPPDGGGDKLRLYHFLEQLKKKGHSIDLFCLTRLKRDLPLASKLLKICDRVHAEHLTDFDLFFNILGAAITGRSFHIFSYFSPRFRDALKAYGSSPDGQSVDVVLAHRLRMAPYAFELTNHKPIVLELTDSMSLVAQNIRKTKGIRLSRRLVSMWDNGILDEEEAEWVKRSARSILVSPFDAEVLASKGVERSKISVIPNGLTLMPSRKTTRPVEYTPGSAVVAFVGSLEYPPNEEGFLWFLKNVWPKVKQQIPNAILAGVGGYPRNAIRRLDNGSDVRVTGWVSSVEPYLLHAGVSIAPLAVTAGMQNKVALSMALGIPVVATPGALNWLPEKARSLAVSASDADAFATAVVECLLNPRKSRTRVQKAKRFIRMNYQWNKSGTQMDAVLKQAVKISK